MRIMAKAFPSGEYKTWIDCQVLLPHSKEVMSYVSSDEDEVLNRATVAGNTAWYLYLRGEYAAAEEISRDALDGREKVLGLEHPSMLISISKFSLVLESLGKYEEMEVMQ